MQRKVVLTLALVFCLASYAQAALTITVGSHVFPSGTTGPQVIPITVSGTDLVHGTDIVAQLGGSSGAVAPFGAAPPLTYQGSEQYNNPTPGTGAAVLSPSLWDVHANTWGDSTSGNFDGVPSIPGSQTGAGPTNYGDPGFEGTWFSGSLTFNSTTVATGTANPNGGVEVNLVVDFTGFTAGTWPLFLAGGAAGPTDFVDRLGAFIPLTIVDGSITLVPEPASLVLGLFAAAALGVVAIRARRRARA